ncbi:pfs domain-containing protein [Fusarium heterosporum]|uniref:Pfs domain-containing protein n=1 Tax=Fusarium heterosporum TaxID=42747 RepID=A0A8H5WGD2_FUSHE|nr:pfs domain-containing protein [Fusarium heterosporum]
MDTLLCCLRSPKGRLKDPSKLFSISHPIGRDSTDSLAPKKEGTVDLLEDEGEDYQNDEWKLVLSEKTQALQNVGIRLAPNIVPEQGSFLLADHIGETSPQKFVQSLTVLYTDSGHSVLRYASFWDDLRVLFEDVVRSLPRFHGYIQVLRTPRLHAALRGVYSTFLDLCIMTLDCLSTDKCYMVMRVQWSSFALQFKDTAALLAKLNEDFEKEAHFAHIQKEDQRHNQLMGALLPLVRSGRLQSNVSISRNTRFMGRDDTLALIHSTLESAFAVDQKSRSFRSCLLHAVGGMGKTETALEYTYRFSQYYGYIIWLRSQTKASIYESFIDAVIKLGIVTDSKLSPTRIKDEALRWFQTTGKRSPKPSNMALTSSAEERWLLVYDNAEDHAVLQEYWPVGCLGGAAIITSQDPAFNHVVSRSVQLQPLTATEGSKLIQNYLRRGDSEQQSAEQLSTTLGGMPLAIVHFTGYISRSQCPIEHITANLDHRLKSSKIFKMKGNITSAARKYEHTLSTVWDLAFRRLSDDARLLLEYIAFLDPDDIPVDIFIGTSDSLVENASRATNHWAYWDRDRFNEAVSILLERNLVHRTVMEGSDSLRTHRALQMCILQELDEDLPERTLRFNEVVSILRKAIPVFNIVKRSDSSQFPRFAKYTPQTSALLKVFQSSEPAIPGSLDFASVLNDVCYYLYNQSDSALAFGFAETGDRVCSDFPDETDSQNMRSDFLSIMGMIVYEKGVSGRQKGLSYMRNVVDLRKKALDGIPRGDWTELQTVNFARAHADLGCVLCQCNEFDEAAPLFQICVDIYTNIQNENRLALILSNQVLVFSTSQNVSDTREKGRLAVNKIESLLDPDNPLIFLIKYHVSQAYFTIGDVHDALALILPVFQHRANKLGRSHHLTLASQYFLAVLYQNLGDLVKAESNLREALEHGHQTDVWREDDIVRVKFRLSIVLRAQQKNVDAEEISSEIASHVKSLRTTTAEFTDADDMALLDWQVNLDHFRTAGIWSNGSAW